MPGEYKLTALTRSLAKTLGFGSSSEPGVNKLGSDSVNVEVTTTEVGAVACEGG